MSINLLVAAIIVGVCGTLGSIRIVYQADKRFKTKYPNARYNPVGIYNLKWAKYFFIYHNMREGKITKVAFWAYIALYINTVLFVSAVIGASITHAFPFQLVTVIFGFASIAIIIITGIIGDSIDKLIYQKQHKQLWDAAQAAETQPTNLTPSSTPNSGVGDSPTEPTNPTSPDSLE